MKAAPMAGKAWAPTRKEAPVTLTASKKSAKANKITNARENALVTQTATTPFSLYEMKNAGTYAYQNAGCGTERLHVVLSSYCWL